MSFPFMTRVTGIFIDPYGIPVTGLVVTATPKGNFRPPSPSLPGHVLIATSVTQTTDGTGTIDMSLVTDVDMPIVYDWLFAFNGKTWRATGHLPPLPEVLIADMLPSNTWNGGYTIVPLPPNPSWLSP